MHSDTIIKRLHQEQCDCTSTASIANIRSKHQKTSVSYSNSSSS